MFKREVVEVKTLTRTLTKLCHLGFGFSGLSPAAATCQHVPLRCRNQDVVLHQFREKDGL